MYVDYGTLAAFLPVVYPADNGHNTVEERFIRQAVFSVKADSIGIMFVKQVERMHHLVLIAEQSVHAISLFSGYMGKTLLRYLLVLFHQGLGHDELLYAVLSQILIRLFAHHTVFVHRFSHSESRINDNSVVAVEHFRVHSSHRSADDKAGTLFAAHTAEQRHSLFGMQR